MQYDGDGRPKKWAVYIHCRIKSPDDISAIRVTMGECDALIGGDLVASSGSKCLNLTANGHTKAVMLRRWYWYKDTDFKIPNDQLIVSMEAKLKEGLSQFLQLLLAYGIDTLIF